MDRNTSRASLIGEVMYCTVILSDVPMVCAVEKPSGLWVVQDITLKRPPGTSVGILLRHADEGTQMVESVQQNSPAQTAGLRRNDVLLAVNGTYLNSGQQAAKLFTSSNIDGDDNSITVRVKRLVQPDPRKVAAAEHRSLGSDGHGGAGAGVVVGEDTTSGRGGSLGGLAVVVGSGVGSSQPSVLVAACVGSSSSHSGEKKNSIALIGASNISTSDSSSSRSSGGNVPCCIGGSSGSSGGHGRNSRSGSRCGSDEAVLTPGTGTGSSLMTAVGMGIGSSGSGVGVGVSFVDDQTSKATISPTTHHLLAGVMGGPNGGGGGGVGPAARHHRSLPGSPVLQRTARHRVNSTRDGDISGSGKSTPDSSHNNSPELKRKLLDLHSFPCTSTMDTRTHGLNPLSSTNTNMSIVNSAAYPQDRSPTVSSSTISTRNAQQQQKNATGVGGIISQEKSMATGGSTPASQNTAATNEKTPPPQSNQSSKAGTPTTTASSPEIVAALNAATEKRGSGLRRHAPGRNKTHLKILQTPFVDGSCDPVFDSDFEFWLEEDNRHMSIAVWSRNISSKPDHLDHPYMFLGDRPNHRDTKDRSKDNSKTSSRSTDRGSADKDHRRHRRRSRDGDRSRFSDDVTCGLTDDTLVGFTNLSLVSMIPETTLTTQGHVTKLATLSPPHPRCPEVASDFLMSHKGYNPSLCYGDIMLSLTYQPQDRCEALGRGVIDRSAMSEDESMTDGTISEEDGDILGLQEPATGGDDRNHDFKRTHFHSATQCDFCKKKIWLKDAYQCSECAIICHKKCMVRCEQETSCDSTGAAGGGLRYRDSPRTSTTATDAKDAKDTPPEIITTAALGSPNSAEGHHTPGNTPPASPQSQRRTLSSLFAQVVSNKGTSLKRAGSAHNLAPPTPNQSSSSSPDGTNQSRSLPPSPPHSPQHSRKVAVWEGTNPFVVEWDEGDTIQAALDRLLLLPHDERLVTLARDSACDLHSRLPTRQRLDTINDTLGKLQSCIDSEGEVRMDLARQEREASEAGDSLTLARVSLQISQCDARTQALALLTLHYCTALQYCSAQDESSKRQCDGNLLKPNTKAMTATPDSNSSISHRESDH